MASSLPPGIAGFVAAQENARRGDMANMHQISGLLSLQNALRQQEREDQFAPLKMDLLRAQTADVLAKPEDRRIAQQNVREMALARLQQAGMQNDRTYEISLRNARSTEERNRITEDYNRNRLMLEAAARQQGAERLFYDTGIRTSVPNVGVPIGAPAPAPAAPAGLESLLQGRPPAEQAAILSAAGNAPSNLIVAPQGLVPGPGHGGSQPASANATAAPVAPVNAAVPATATPPLTARTIGPFVPADGGATPSGLVPAAGPIGASPAPSAPEMPQFVGSPGERAAETNKWLAAQSKAASGPEKALPASAAKGFLDNMNNLRKAETALALLEGKNVGVAQGDTEATGKKGLLTNLGVIGDKTLNWLDPQGVDTRAAIGDLGSIVIHDRSGAAVTAAEFPRLRPFIPLASDAPDVAIKKARRFVQEYKAEVEAQRAFFGESGYKVPQVGQPPAPSGPPGGVERRAAPQGNVVDFGSLPSGR